MSTVYRISDTHIWAQHFPICGAVLWTDLAWLRRGNFTPRQMVPPRQLTPHFPICGAVLWTDLAWTWHWAQFYTKAILLPICGAALWTDLAWTWHLAQGKLLHRGNFTPRQFYFLSAKFVENGLLFNWPNLSWTWRTRLTRQIFLENLHPTLTCCVKDDLVLA